MNRRDLLKRLALAPVAAALLPKRVEVNVPPQYEFGPPNAHIAEDTKIAYLVRADGPVTDGKWIEWDEGDIIKSMETTVNAIARSLQRNGHCP